MALFNDLPNELIHNIAYRLVPSRCDDLNLDILAFRALDRRAWLVANELACYRMTFHLGDAVRSQRFSDFCYVGRADGAGRDMRNYVREVRIFRPPQVTAFGCFLGDLPNKFYREKADQFFRHFLQKEEKEMDARERVAAEHYWEICIKPYISDGTTYSRSQQILTTLTTTLSKLKNAQTVNLDLDHHFPNTSSTGWRALEDLGVIDQIYDKMNERFKPLPPEDSMRVDIAVDYDTGDVARDIIIGNLPSSITKLKSRNAERELIPQGILPYHNNNQHITEIDVGLQQQKVRLMPLQLHTLPGPFPNLRRLRLRSLLHTQREQHEIWDEEPFFFQERKFAIVPNLLNEIGPIEHLETVHVDGYVLGVSSLREILKYAVQRDLSLVLEDTMLLRATLIETPSATFEYLDCWAKIFNLVRSEFGGYVSTGRLQWKGFFTCATVPLNMIPTVSNSPNPQADIGVVMQHDLSGCVRNTFQKVVRTGENFEDFYAEMLERSSPTMVEKKTGWISRQVLERETRWKIESE